MVNKVWEQRRSALRNVLKSMRDAAGYTQEQMAELLGKPQSYISKYENGERRLDFIEVLEICDALHVSIQECMSGYKKELEMVSK